MQYVDNILEREAERLQQCLDMITRDKLIQILDKVLIKDFLEKFLASPPEVDVE
jgi:hypothetical protein